MNLIIEYFTSRNHMRNGEFLYCLHQNIGNEYIKSISIFIEEGSDLFFDSPKIKKIVRKTRPTYKELFDYCNENYNGEACIVSNADIIFDDTLRYFDSINMHKNFYALSRWEISTNDGKNWEIEPYENAASQDCWIFRTPIPTSDEMNYTMGKPGCDNKITYNMRDLGWTVRNPGKKVISVHFHPTNFRTYHFNDDRVPGPYLLVAPTDNFTGEPCHFDIDGFNEKGEPYRIQK